EPNRALAEDLWHSAWSSAYGDPRFQPVSSEELTRLQISISVLSPLREIHFRGESQLIESLEPGVDGLVLQLGAQRVTFLPAVWKSVADPVEFLTELKRKAGWPTSVWPPGVTAFRYQTETFGSSGRNALAA